jgi:hypothetical protein
LLITRAVITRKTRFKDSTLILSPSFQQKNGVPSAKKKAMLFSETMNYSRELSIRISMVLQSLVLCIHSMRSMAQKKLENF